MNGIDNKMLQAQFFNRKLCLFLFVRHFTQNHSIQFVFVETLYEKI